MSEAGTVAEVARARRGPTWPRPAHERRRWKRSNESRSRDPSPKGRRIVTKPHATRGSRNPAGVFRSDLKRGELAGWQDPRSSDPNCKDNVRSQSHASRGFGQWGSSSNHLPTERSCLKARSQGALSRGPAARHLAPVSPRAPALGLPQRPWLPCPRASSPPPRPFCRRTVSPTSSCRPDLEST